MKIEILGPGCSRCAAAAEHVRQALRDLSVHAEVVYVTDPAEIAARQILLWPAVLVDGVLRSCGRVPCVDEVKHWLARVGNPATRH